MSKSKSRKEQGASNREGHETLCGLTRRNFLKCSAGAIASVCFGSLLSGCVGGSDGPDPTFPVVVFSDIHFNPFYDPSLFPTLKAVDPSQWAAIFQGSAITAPSTWGCHWQHPLRHQLPPPCAHPLGGKTEPRERVHLVIYTGDILGHIFANIFYPLYGSHDVAAVQTFADNTVAFFMEQVRSAVGNLPVLFALGNADSYGGYGAESAFLSSTAQLFYSQFLNGIVDQQTFLDYLHERRLLFGGNPQPQPRRHRAQFVRVLLVPTLTPLRPS